MSDIEFRDPPRPPRGRGSGANHVAIASQLRDEPGQWALVQRGMAAASSTTSIVKARSSAYAPAGSFEAVSRSRDGKYDIYARYVGENGEHR